MHEDRNLAGPENQVWPSGQLPVMERIPQAATMQVPPHNHFRFGVAASNSRHNAASGFFAHEVHAAIEHPLRREINHKALTDRGHVVVDIGAGDKIAELVPIPTLR